MPDPPVVFCPGRDEYGCAPSTPIPGVRYLTASDDVDTTFDGSEVFLQQRQVTLVPVWEWECGCFSIVRSGDYGRREPNDE